MVPYASSSPIPLNGTAAATSQMDVTAMAITGVAVGALGLGSVAVLFQYLKPQPKVNEEEDKENQEASQEANQADIQKEIQITEVQMPDPLTYLCINTVDLEDIALILTAFKKRFQVISIPPHITAH